MMLFHQQPRGNQSLGPIESFVARIKTLIDENLTYHLILLKKDAWLLGILSKALYINTVLLKITLLMSLIACSSNHLLIA